MKAFIVHGSDSVATLELSHFLSRLGLEAVVLEEQDDRGSMTVIEKFEHYAEPCELAFVLMTPDDELSTTGNPAVVTAARQNVMIELGWFIRHLGRQRVTLLHKEGTSIPSNIAGILYLPYKQTVGEISEGIRSRLRTLNVPLSS